MKFVFALALAFGVATICNAIPLKKDDTPELKDEGERFVANRFEEFQTAARQGQRLDTFFQDLLEYVKKAQTNNKKLTTGIKVIVGQLKVMTLLGVNPVSSVQLHALTAAVDGNRDNVSYYVLDYAAKWIESRINYVEDPQVQGQLESIRNDIVEARDRLDSNAQTFVNGIKDIKEWTHMGRGMGHARQIKQIIKDIDEGSKDPTLIEKTDSAVSKIQYLIGY